MISSDPYSVLGVPSDAGDDVIRRRYLELVRTHTPERDPERFIAIRAAYEKLRDPVTRLRHRLFEQGRDDSIESLVTAAKARVARRRLSVETLLRLGSRHR